MEPKAEVCRYCGVASPWYCINENDAKACLGEKVFQEKMKQQKKHRMIMTNILMSGTSWGKGKKSK
jgi:hypothetical protein